MTSEEVFQPIEHAWQQALEQASADGDQRPTWAHVWPAGRRLCTILPDLFASRGAQLLEHKKLRCCDLGCGQGVVGLALIDYLQDTIELDCCFADGSPHPLSYVDAMLAHYELPGFTKQHQWGTRLPGDKYDLILGGDILYRPECFDDLMKTIAHSLNLNGQAWLSDPRQQLESKLSELAQQHGLAYTQERFDDEQVTLVVVTRYKN